MKGNPESSTQCSRHNRHFGFKTTALLQAVLVLAFGQSGALAQAAPTAPGDDGDAVLVSLTAGTGVHIWPARHQRAIICAVHGTTQQAGCFSKLAHHLTEEGYTLIAIDLRAHGQWFWQTDTSNSKHRLDYARSAEDLAQLSAAIRQKFPNTPLYCLGESVGAGVAALAASKNHNLYDGVILASPGSTPGFYNPVLVVRDFLRGIVRLDRQMDVRTYITKYSSEDPRITNEMITDELSRTTLTAREILKTAAFIHKIPRFAGTLSPETPVLVLQGAEDRIVRTSSVRETIRNIPCNDKKLVVFPHCGHLLLGTAYLKDPLVNELITWLAQRSESDRHVVAVQRH